MSEKRDARRALIEAAQALLAERPSARITVREVASRAGCELAIVTADPGSSSGRNVERTGFQLICNHLDMRAPDASRGHPSR